MNQMLYQEALEVAGTYDVATPKNSVVLYSISYLPTTENRDKAFAYVKKHPKSCMIEDTVLQGALLVMSKAMSLRLLIKPMPEVSSGWLNYLCYWKILPLKRLIK